MSESESNDKQFFNLTLSDVVIGLGSFLIISVLYFYVATQNGASLDSYEEPYEKFAKQTFVILEGRLNLGVAQSELLELSDPYDPQLNEPYRLCCFHDEALYEGKIYMVHNIGAVLLHLPFRLLTGEFLNPRLSVLFSSVVASTFLSLLGIELLSQRKLLSKVEIFVASVLLALSSPLTWLVSIGRDYEEAIALGQAFLLAGLYVLIRSHHRGLLSRSPITAFVGFLLLGLAGLSRPTLYLAVPMIILYLCKTRSSRIQLRAIVGALWALVLVGGFQSLYNYLRFENIFEFGTRFQLSGFNMSTYPINSPRHLVPNVLDYLFKLPQFHSNFPWVGLAANSFSSDPLIHYSEPVLGLLYFAPYIFIFAIFRGTERLLATFRSRVGLHKQPLTGVFLVALGGILLLAVSLPFNASTFRYVVDFAPVLMVGSLSLILVERFQKLIAARAFLLLVLLFSALNMYGLAIVPCAGTGSC